MAGDIIYLQELGVPDDEIARRTARTVTAIRHELDTHYEKEKERAATQHTEKT